MKTGDLVIFRGGEAAGVVMFTGCDAGRDVRVMIQVLKLVWLGMISRSQ